MVSTGMEKANPELRKLIRSHVMQGKNRGKTLPQRKRKPKRMQDVSALSSRDLNPGASSAASTTSPPAPAISVSRKLGSDLSGFSWADAVEPRAVEVVLRCELFPTLLPATTLAHLLEISLVHCQKGLVSSGIMYTI